MIDGKTILITGASGFVGACLARRLAGRCTVHLFLREGSARWRLEDMADKFRIRNVDLSNRNAVEKAVNEIRPHVIYHLAAYGGYSHQTDAKMMVETNVSGTVNLLDACAGSDFERFVNVGTSSEYGVKERAMKETDLLEPNGLYGITKAAAAHYCMHMARSSLPVTSFRIFAAYGYFESPGRLIPSLILSALRDERPRLSSPSSVRDFIFIEDIMEALELAAVKEKACGEILNLGTGRQHTVEEAARAALDIAGCGKEPEWGAVENRRKEPKVWHADMSKTKAVLGWEPKHDLASGLTKDIDWFRANMGRYAGKTK
jgi:nucleoside-diphosphate-sugar epimerase